MPGVPLRFPQPMEPALLPHAHATDLYAVPAGPNPFAPPPTEGARGQSIPGASVPSGGSPAPAAAPHANESLITADQLQLEEERAFGDHVDAQATWHADAEGADDDLLDSDGNSSVYMMDEWGVLVPRPTSVHEARRRRDSGMREAAIRDQPP